MKCEKCGTELLPGVEHRLAACENELRWNIAVYGVRLLVLRERLKEVRFLRQPEIDLDEGDRDGDQQT